MGAQVPLTRPSTFAQKIERRKYANENYGILKAASRAGVDVDNYFRARKMYCPFGAVFHSDGGDDPAMRVYAEDDHAYCFACGKSFSPAQLIAAAEDITEDEAVESMLLELGVVDKRLGDRWQSAADDADAVDTQALAEAFRIAASYIITPWSERQYDADVAVWMSKCLALLDKVKTVEQGDSWLATVKQALRLKFGKDES